ncbi:hypothetical protein FRB96_008329 [Tulasnella sp. 330]|nr:hypothetical protein FRB96_008329 [Tulasnella sp. 330]KAG8884792.1 hypothetical protein FRB97_003313 [Tulasnella sp. 331]KAG8889890.1 hypothetical protein FRB98_002244 [Tulasnella sp. 332]
MAEVQQTPPEIKSLDRVTSIPLIHDGIAAVQATLQTYTPTAYAYGAALTNTAYNLSSPLHPTLAPLLAGADGYALAGLDAAEKNFPTPFTIKTEEVVEGVRKRKDDAISSVTRPVYGLANGVDSSLTPIVDRLEEAIHKLGPSSSQTEPDSSAAPLEAVNGTQVGRLYNLSVDLRGKVYNISTEQLKQLQSQNVYIQTATDKVNTLNSGLAASYGSAKGKSIELVQQTQVQAQTYTHDILVELEKIKELTLALPKQVQAKLPAVQAGIQDTVAELTAIVKSDMPVGEKVSKVGSTVQEKVHPLLFQTSQVIQAYIAEAKSYIGGVKAKAADAAEQGEADAKDILEEAKEAVVHDHENDIPSFVPPAEES